MLGIRAAAGRLSRHTGRFFHRQPNAVTRSVRPQNQRNPKALSLSLAATAVAGGLAVGTGEPAQCSNESGGSGFGAWACWCCTGAAGAVGLLGATVAFSLYAFKTEVIQKSPMTEAEIAEVQDLFLKEVTARYRAKGLTPSDAQLEKDAKSAEFVIFMLRAIFAQIQTDGLVAKTDLINSDLSKGQQRIADIYCFGLVTSGRMDYPPRCRRSMDLDDNEKVTCNEFLISCLSQGHDSFKVRLGNTFSALDEDGDGQISQQEMECWIRWNLSQGAALDDPTASAYKKDDQFMLAHKDTLEQLHKERAAYKAVLKAASTKGVAVPSLPHEYNALLSKATKDITQELFDKYDTNKDNRLQLDEFLQIAEGELSTVVFNSMPMAFKTEKPQSQ